MDSEGKEKNIYSPINTCMNDSIILAGKDSLLC